MGCRVMARRSRRNAVELFAQGGVGRLQRAAPEDGLQAVPADEDDAGFVVKTTDGDRVDDVVNEAGGAGRHDATPKGEHFRQWRRESTPVPAVKCRSRWAATSQQNSGAPLPPETSEGTESTENTESTSFF